MRKVAVEKDDVTWAVREVDKAVGKVQTPTGPAEAPPVGPLAGHAWTTRTAAARSWRGAAPPAEPQRQ